MALSAEYQPIAGGAATVRMFYEIFPDGSIKATQTMKEAGGLAKAPALMRFGMKFAMPGRFTTVDFYGKGPWETTPPELRRRCRPLCAECQRRVPLRLCPHSGVRHKTGLRYFRLLDSNGTGLEVTADERFSASALPFSMRVSDCLDNGTPKRANKTNTQNGEARHSLNLKAKAHERPRQRHDNTSTSTSGRWVWVHLIPR